MLGANWLVVEGVTTFAGSPLVGAENGWIVGAVIAPGFCCGWNEPGSAWAQPAEGRPAVMPIMPIVPLDKASIKHRWAGFLMVIVIMGVSGAGKTTIGLRLAHDLHWRFCDGDEFHSPASILKLSRDIPLTDADRRPWLERIRSEIGEWVTRHDGVVLACSLLKASYRATVFAGYHDHIRLVYLKGRYDSVRQRLKRRSGHFVHQGLLASQFAILEEPADAFVVNADQSPDAIIQQIREACAV